MRSNHRHHEDQSSRHRRLFKFQQMTGRNIKKYIYKQKELNLKCIKTDRRFNFFFFFFAAQQKPRKLNTQMRVKYLL